MLSRTEHFFVFWTILNFNNENFTQYIHIWYGISFFGFSWNDSVDNRMTKDTKITFSMRNQMFTTVINETNNIRANFWLLFDLLFWFHSFYRFQYGHCVSQWQSNKRSCCWHLFCEVSRRNNTKLEQIVVWQ